LSYEIYMELIDEPEFREDSRYLGIVLQAYLIDSEDMARKLVDLAEKRHTAGYGPVVVRLIKGAYWGKEVQWAKDNNVSIPVWYGGNSKAKTDAAYERIVQILMPHYKTMRLAFATHNVRSMAVVIATAEREGAPKDAYEFQMLFGMGTSLAG